MPETKVVSIKPPTNGSQAIDTDTAFKINDTIAPHYEHGRGYENGWNDNRVATELGVPITAVEQIRSKRLGPTGDEELRAMVERVEAQAAEMQKHADRLLAESDQMEKMSRQIYADIAPFRERFK